MTISNQQGRLHKTLLLARERGFTMIELMVAVSIIAILATLAVPSVDGIMVSSRLTGGANNFVASALLARSEAIKRNTTVRLCRSSNRTSCAASGGWEQGWVVISETNKGGVITREVLQSEPALPPGYSFTASTTQEETSMENAYNLVFKPIGIGSTEAKLILCRKTPAAAEKDRQERRIDIKKTGRIQVERPRPPIPVCT